MATTKNKKLTADQIKIKKLEAWIEILQKKIDEAKEGKGEKDLIDEIRTIARKHGLENIGLGETLNRLDGALAFAKAMESQIEQQDQQIKLLVRDKENAHRAISDLSSRLALAKSRDRGETAFRRYVYTHVMIAMMDEFKGKPLNDHARLIAARAEKIIGYAEKFAKGS